MTLLEQGGPGVTGTVIEGLKAAGAVRKECEDHKMEEGDDTCVRWYAGSALDVLESGAYFAVNSLLNCLERFCPEKHP